MALKVLSVDDSKTIRMIVKKAFKEYDCELFEAENGVEGLSLAGKEKPDIIVLDITMPVMNGIEMLEKMKQEASLKDIPVIMLTAESGKENVVKIVQMGVKDYIVKPFKGEQLIDRVQKLVELKPKPVGGGDSGEGLDKYFKQKGEIVYFVLPEKITRRVNVAIEGGFQVKAKAINASGTDKLVVDLRSVAEANVALVKLIMNVAEKSRQTNLQMRLLGTPQLGEKLSQFHETSEFQIITDSDAVSDSFK